MTLDNLSHRFTIRVYYEDTDTGGVVYHANYLKFAERARSEMLRSIGIEQEALRRTTGLAFAVHHCTVDFIQPARLDDELTVITQVTALGGASIAFQQQIQRQNTKLTHLTLRVACVGSNGRPCRLPPELRA